MIKNLSYKFSTNNNIGIIPQRKPKINSFIKKSLEKFRYKVYNLYIDYVYDAYYTGTQIKPEVIIRDENTKERLIEGKDFETICENNINVGKATVLIEGKGKYKYSSKISEFNILPAPLYHNSETKYNTRYIYSGTEIQPEVKVIHKGIELVKGVDYKISYDCNINVGTGIITIQGIGNYTGKITNFFTINPKAINEITKEELINAHTTYRLAENQFPDTLSGVSTVGNVTNGKMDIFYGIVSEATDGVYNLMSVTQTEINCSGDEECVDKNYIAFDVFLLVTVPATIAITPTSNVVPTEGAIDKGSQNAARVGFVVEGTVNQNVEPYVAQGLRGGRKGLIWEPNYDRHTESGVKAAKEFYNITTQESGAARLPYKGINSEFGVPVLLTETHTSPYFSDVTPDIATTQTFMNSQVLTNIPAGITKIRVYLWLEGQDVDMENNAANTKLSYNLELAMLN